MTDNNYNLTISSISDDIEISSDSDYTISEKDILNTIPSNAVNTPDLFNSRIKKEIRWTFFEFPKNNKYIEISFKKPNENRFFLDKNNKWIENAEDYTLKYKNYITKIYYAYE